MRSSTKNVGFSFRRFFLASFVTLVLTAPLVHVARSLGDGPDALAFQRLKKLLRPHVVILKSKRVLHLFDGDVLVRSFPCDLGSNPIGDKRRVGDGKTPIGQFHIVSKNPQSPYRRFLGIDYPHAEAVAEGRLAGVISEGDAESILAALRESRCPDWSTALGGGIGIHGHRKSRDWTGGCIAVSNKAVDTLFRVLRIGDSVEILP